MADQASYFFWNIIGFFLMVLATKSTIVREQIAQGVLIGDLLFIQSRQMTTNTEASHV